MKISPSSVLAISAAAALLLFPPPERNTSLPVEGGSSRVTLSAISTDILAPVTPGTVPAAPTPAVPDMMDVTAQIRAAAYWFFPSLTGGAGVLEAGNKTQHMGVRMDAEGLTLTTNGERWTLGAAGLTGTVPVAEKDKVSRRRGRVEEWFHNAPRGLEHGFVLHEGGAADDGEERIPLELSSPWRGVVSPDGRGVSFMDERGARQLGYEQLRAWDATGRDLPARMELADASLTLCVNTSGARWPVTIDPLISTGSGLLRAADTTTNDGFGSSVIVDGNWLIAGAPSRPNANGGTGAVFFFQFNEATQTWVERQKIGAPSASTRYFGRSMVLSGDRLAVYAEAPLGTPRFHFIQRSLTGGTLLTETLTFSAGTNIFSVALEGNDLAVATGLTAVSTYSRVNGLGGAMIWFPTGTLTPTAGAGITVHGFGGSLAMRGGLLMAGANDSDKSGAANIGTVHFFRKNGLSWSQAGWFAGAVQNEYLGTSVAIMDDGTALAADYDAAASVWPLVPDAAAPGGWKQMGLIRVHPGPPEVLSNLSGTTVATCGGEVLQAGQVGQGLGAYPVFATLDRRRGGSATEWEKAGTLTFPIPGGFMGGASMGTDWIAVGALVSGSPPGIALWRRSGASWAPVTAVRAAETNAGDHFGSVVACDGRTLAVGAPERDNILRGGPDVGAVYVFVRDETLPGSWKLQGTLLGSATINGDRFGSAVALGDRWIAVGAKGHDEAGAVDAGEVYLFERNSNGTAWTQAARSSSTAAGQQMGAALVMTEGFVIAGAPGAGNGGIRYLARTAGSLGAPGTLITAPGNSTGLRAGAALYLHDGALVIGGPGRIAGTAGKAWLMPADGAAHATVDGVTVREFLSPAANEASFGVSVVAGGRHIFAGAPDANGGTGQVWRFDLDAPGPFTELISSAQHLTERGFGAAMAWSGDRLFVGAPDTRAGESVCGAVFTMEPPDAQLLRRFFTATNPVAGQRLGAALCASGGVVWAGAPGDDTTGDQAGAAFAFQEGASDWSTASTVSIGNASENFDRLGESVAIDGDFAVIGAPGDETAGNEADSGTAYILSRRLGWGVEAILSAGSGNTGEEFGKCVAISGQTVVVGMPGASGRVGVASVADVGRAYVFTRTPGAVPVWTLAATLTPAYNLNGSLTPGGREFGESVAIDGDLIVIGAPGTDSGKGKAFLYGRRSVYNPAASVPWPLLNSYQNPAGPLRQGRAVALDGVRLAILGEDSSQASRIQLTVFDYDRENNWWVSIGANEFASAGNDPGDTDLTAALRAHVALDGPHFAVAWANDNNGHIDFFHDGKLVRRLRYHTPNGIISSLGSSISLDGGRALMSNYGWIGSASAVLWRWHQGVAPGEAWASAGTLNTSAGAISGTQVSLRGDTAVLSGLTSPPSVFVARLERGDYDRWLRRQFTDASVDNPALASTWAEIADPDKDGLNNLTEAYLGSSPVSAADGGSFFDTPVRAGNEIIIRWRKSRDDAGVSASPQWSPDLTRWYLSGDGPDAGSVKSFTIQNLGSFYNDAFDTMEVRLPVTTGGKAWLRLLLRR